MKVVHEAEQPQVEAPPAHFTGDVIMKGRFQRPAPARLAGIVVSFAPGSRTHWHTHPLGQTLFILDGVGRVQSHGGPVVEVSAGDVVWFEPGEKHWHGAAPNTPMTHVAVQEAADGRTVDWLERVADEEYLGCLQQAS